MLTKLLPICVLVGIAMIPADVSAQAPSIDIETKKLERMVGDAHKMIRRLAPTKKAELRTQLDALHRAAKSKRSEAAALNRLYRSFPQLRLIVQSAAPHASPRQQTDLAILIGIKIKF